MSVKPLPEVCESGDRRAALEELRQVLARAIDDGPPPRDLASLSLRLMAVLEQLDALGSKTPKESPLDELRPRRAKRQATG